MFHGDQSASEARWWQRDRSHGREEESWTEGVTEEGVITLTGASEIKACWRGSGCQDRPNARIGMRGLCAGYR
jgi:hypothetical protein